VRVPSRRGGRGPSHKRPIAAAPLPAASGPESWRTLTIAAAIAIAAAMLYTWTAARDIVLGDTPEVVTTAVTLGVAHPSGYPLLTLLGHAMSRLPLGPLAFRVNLLSALCGAATVALVSLIARRISGQWMAAVGAAALIAVQPLYWEWSLVAEAFALNAMLAAGFLYALVRWHEVPGDLRWLIVAATAFGSGLANHLTIVCLAPAVLPGVWRHRAVVAARPSVVGWCAAALGAGLLFYLYLPWAAARQPYLNWGHISSARQLVYHVLRLDYGAMLTSAPAATIASNTSDRVLLFFSSFTWLEAGLVVLGLGVAFRRARTYFWIAILSAGLAGPVFAAVANIDVSITGHAWVLRRFFVLPHVILAPLVALGLVAIAGAILRVAPAGVRPRVLAGVTAALMIWLGVDATRRFPTLDERENHLARTYGEDILATLDPGSVLLASGDDVIQSIAYLQAVEHQRPDVTLVMLGHLSRSEWYLDQLRARDPRLAIPFSRYDAPSPAASIAALVQANPARPFALMGPPPDQSLERTHWYRPRGLVLQIEPLARDVTLAAMADDNDRLLRRYRIPSPALATHMNFDSYVLRAYATPARLMGYQMLAADLRPQAAAWFQRALAIDPTYAEAREGLARATGTMRH
jgi:hypothetical protein